MVMFVATHETPNGEPVMLLRTNAGSTDGKALFCYVDGNMTEFTTINPLPAWKQAWTVQVSYTNKVTGYQKLATNVDRDDVVAQVGEYSELVHRDGDVRADAVIQVLRPAKR